MEDREVKIGIVVIICLVIYVAFVMPKLDTTNVAHMTAAEVDMNR